MDKKEISVHLPKHIINKYKKINPTNPGKAIGDELERRTNLPNQSVVSISHDMLAELKQINPLHPEQAFADAVRNRTLSDDDVKTVTQLNPGIMLDNVVFDGSVAITTGQRTENVFENTIRMKKTISITEEMLDRFKRINPTHPENAFQDAVRNNSLSDDDVHTLQRINPELEASLENFDNTTAVTTSRLTPLSTQIKQITNSNNNLKPAINQTFKRGIFKDMYADFSSMTVDQIDEALKESLEDVDQLKVKLRKTTEEKRKFLEAWKLTEHWHEYTKPFILEKNDCSRLHTLKQAITSKEVLSGDYNVLFETTKEFRQLTHTFVIKHDWASVLDPTSLLESEFRLPYTMCAFEFRISGKSVIAVMTDPENICSIFVQTNNWWFSTKEIHQDTTLSRLIVSNIKSTCLALDLEIATHEVVRAPVKLNQKRMKQGKVPLLDYRIVDLSKRHRVANPLPRDTSPDHEIIRRRLHFRRGHYRLVPQRGLKTWIKPHLVGNPDLGFVDKHYLL